MPKSLLTGQKKNRHIGFGVLIVHSSMLYPHEAGAPRDTTQADWLNIKAGLLMDCVKKGKRTEISRSLFFSWKGGQNEERPQQLVSPPERRIKTVDTRLGPAFAKACGRRLTICWRLHVWLSYRRDCPAVFLLDSCWIIASGVLQRRR